VSDERLRELERRWKETGSVEDEAAWLRERVRAGELAQYRVDLACFCEHAGALLAAGRARSVFRPPYPPTDDLTTWPFNKEALTRFTLAFAQLALDRAPEKDRDANAVLVAVEAWLACPCHDHQVAAYRTTGPLPHELIGKRRHGADVARAAVLAYEATLNSENVIFSLPDRIVDLLGIVRRAGANDKDVRDALAPVAEWALGERGTS
jgi:hypothetical protein